mgnify:CR=1 FL=1|jgi:hypothetical protein|tara:strand:+ start:916 stop:1296 length:381 start_codon:yes stop_codon:yes gene_type:complete
MAGGIYNETYFKNYPEEKEVDGVLYGVILVNKKTFERECIKVGIAKGKDWRHVVKRSGGFKGYDLRIQRTYASTLYEVYQYEQRLHKAFEKDSYKPKQKFGGHTECFTIDSDILKAFPDREGLIWV